MELRFLQDAAFGSFWSARFSWNIGADWLVFVLLQGHPISWRCPKIWRRPKFPAKCRAMFLKFLHEDTSKHTTKTHQKGRWKTPTKTPRKHTTKKTTKTPRKHTGKKPNENAAKTPTEHTKNHKKKHLEKHQRKPPPKSLENTNENAKNTNKNASRTHQKNHNKKREHQRERLENTKQRNVESTEKSKRKRLDTYPKNPSKTHRGTSKKPKLVSTSSQNTKTNANLNNTPKPANKARDSNNARSPNHFCGATKVVGFRVRYGKGGCLRPGPPPLKGRVWGGRGVEVGCGVWGWGPEPFAVFGTRGWGPSGSKQAYRRGLSLGLFAPKTHEPRTGRPTNYTWAISIHPGD